MRFGINPTIQTTGRPTDMAITAHDIVSDSPTNNFAALNPLYNSSISLSDGNLTTGTFLASAGSVSSSMQMLPNAITYFEIYYETSYLSLLNIGLMEGTNTSNSWGIRGDGEPWNNAPQTAVSISFTTEDVLGVIVDIQNSKWYLAKNGALQLSANISNGTGYIHNNLTSNLSLRCWNASNSGSQKIRVNFGQDPTFGGASNLPTGAGDYDTDASGNSTGGRFAFQPPTGALALCTANLPDFTLDVTGDTPQHYFKAVLYTGNGSTQSITGVGFQPDFVWSKPRSAGFNIVRDSVRGSTYRLITDGTYAELSDSNYGTFSSDGFNLGAENNINANTVNYIAWCFRAGGEPSGSTSTTGSAKRINTSGTQDDTSCSALATAATNAGASNVITPTLMSINQAAGFSIVKYTGNGGTRTVPHGLSSAPDFIIIKSLSEGTTNYTGQWDVYHTSLGANKLIALNTTGAYTSPTNVWTATPDSNVITIGSAAAINYSSDNYIAYCWHSVEGYSKFGSYTGNGSTDGPFVYCGFRPAFVMIKQITTTSDYSSWAIFDNARDPSNPTNYLHSIFANRSAQEGKRGDGTSANSANVVVLDILSNGFKLRDVGSSEINQDTKEYIFMAFAEQPFKFSNAR